MNIEIEKKPKSNIQKAIKLICPKTIYELKEVQEIKDAIQEHLLFIGLDHSNTVRNIRIIGIGTNSYICVDSKDIVRNALINANSKVVLVHNHPSNTLKPSNQDLIITNTTKQLLKDFNIDLVDHIIVTSESYCSMLESGELKKCRSNFNVDTIEKVKLLEENIFLKEKIKELRKSKIKLNNKDVEIEV